MTQALLRAQQHRISPDQVAVLNAKMKNSHPTLRNKIENHEQITVDRRCTVFEGVIRSRITSLVVVLDCVKGKFLFAIVDGLFVGSIEILWEDDVPVLPNRLESSLGTNGTNIGR